MARNTQRPQTPRWKALAELSREGSPAAMAFVALLLMAVIGFGMAAVVGPSSAIAKVVIVGIAVFIVAVMVLFVWLSSESGADG